MSLSSPIPVLGTLTTATSGRSAKFRKGANPNPVEFVEDFIAGSLLPTPSVAHVRNHDEPLENYLQRRKDYEDGRTSGMPGASLGVAIRLEQEGIELFQTPVAVEGDGGAVSAELKKSRGHFVMLRDQIYDLFPTPRATRGESSTETQNLLPTPLVDDSKNTGDNLVRRPSLASETYAMGNLLPTPLANAARGASQTAIAKGNPKNRYAEEVEIINNNGVWGKYAPAIERWENVLGRPAPAPTRPDGKNNSHRLSPEFTEWMMGLPSGWITGCGLKRNEELKACGNGVVPQQAAYALSILLADLPAHIKLSTD